MMTLRLICLASLIALISLPVAYPRADADERPVVIVNKRQGEFGTATVKAIFSMRKRTWDDGMPIQVFVLPPSHPLHAQFTKWLFGIQPYQLERAWNRQLFGGISNKPVVVKSLSEMVDRVRATPGAIGYISGSYPVNDMSGLHILRNAL